MLGVSLIAASAVSVAGPAAAAPPSVTVNPSRLSGVYCTSAANCWAVGDIEVKGARLNRVLHWTDKKWIKVTVPSPAGTAKNDLSELRAVRCAAAADCWAVGDTEGAHGGEHNQVLHWNGKSWLVVRVPSPGAALNSLSDVACTSPSSCWAVGVQGPLIPALAGREAAAPAGVKFFELNEILHWNGTKWTLAAAPNPGGTGQNAISELDSVRCASADDCWAAGTDGVSGDSEVIRNQMLHWNGRKWAQVSVPNPAGTTSNRINEIFGLSCTSAANCWAAGDYGRLGAGNTSRFSNQVLRWNGRKWFKASVLNPDGTGPGDRNGLFAINCLSATNCWAVGDSGGRSTAPTVNQVLHWNGAHWSKISTPNPGGMGPDGTSLLTSVRCTGATNCWAVGIERTGSGTELGQILHWTGKKWFVSGTPAAAAAPPAGYPGVVRGPARPATMPNSVVLNGVFCPSAATCWAVGNFEPGAARVNRVLRLTGKKWVPVPVPSPGGTATDDVSELLAVRCTSAADCWAAGDYQHAAHADLNQLLHWNGKKWTSASAPSPGGTHNNDFSSLNDVACISSTSCWAVGTAGRTSSSTDVERNEALHWNGKKWSVSSTPNPAGTGANSLNDLASVRCAGPADCWAAGTEGTFNGDAIRNEMLHWNGKKWASVSVPSPGGSGKGHIDELNGLTCTSATDCWAAGTAARLGSSPVAAKSLNELLHWTGKKWFSVSAPDPDGTKSGANNQLEGITCATTSDCWAVGFSGNAQSGEPLTDEAFHFTGKTWTAVGTPNPGGTKTGDTSFLNSVRCTSAGNCWAVGASQLKDQATVGQILHWTGKHWFVSNPG